MHTGRLQRHESEVEVGMGMMRRHARAPITKDHPSPPAACDRIRTVCPIIDCHYYGLLRPPTRQTPAGNLPKSNTGNRPVSLSPPLWLRVMCVCA